MKILLVTFGMLFSMSMYSAAPVCKSILTGGTDNGVCPNGFIKPTEGKYTGYCCSPENKKTLTAAVESLNSDCPTDDQTSRYTLFSVADVEAGKATLPSKTIKAE